MSNAVNENKVQIKIYLFLVLGVCFFLGVAAYFTQASDESIAYQILYKGFTAFPVMSAVITRRITKDKTKWRCSIKVWKNPTLWIFCAFVPSILIVIGAALYFVIFPKQYSGILDIASLMGMDYNIPINNPFQFAIVCVSISALCIPIQLLELGEEIGWREYLLPKQVAIYGVRKGVLLNGFYWGAAHLPLIFFGFNYSPENAGAPWSNMFMMIVVCMTLGIICAYVMIISDNVMHCAIIHGAVNVIGEIPVFISVSHKSGLLGPNPTGMIGMSGLFICAIIMFIRLPKLKTAMEQSA